MGRACYGRTWEDSILPSEEDATLWWSLVGNEGREMYRRKLVRGLLFTSQ